MNNINGYYQCLFRLENNTYVLCTCMGMHVIRQMTDDKTTSKYPDQLCQLFMQLLQPWLHLITSRNYFQLCFFIFFLAFEWICGILIDVPCKFSSLKKFFWRHSFWGHIWMIKIASTHSWNPTKWEI